MDIPANTVFDVLENNGVEHLYHANSVLTSSQFLRSKSLVSRGSVERLDVAQTEQSSDQADKRHSVWFDVFADAVDIHHRVRNVNHYGPVLFELSLDIIRRSHTGRVWITKLNPTKWAGMKRRERWFQSKEDLEENFVAGNFDHMIVFRHCGGALPFGNFLQRIILDDPHMKVEGIDLFSAGFGALALAMSDAGLRVPITRRKCRAQCGCTKTYAKADDRAVKMFLPGV